MDNTFSKTHKVGSMYTYITYSLDNVNNGNVLASIYTDLVSKGINVESIMVDVYSNDGVQETAKEYYDNIEKYFEDYNKKFTDNSIIGVSLVCEYNRLNFKVSVDARLKKISIIVMRKVDENKFNLDDVVGRAVKH